MLLSILHRATGTSLGIGTLGLVWWAWAVSSGPEAYRTFQSAASHPVGQIILFGFSYALVFHSLNGIRHLFWDLGMGFEKKTVTRSGRAVLILSVVLTIGLWLAGYQLAGRISLF